jgi:hypothetical protein
MKLNDTPKTSAVLFEGDLGSSENGIVDFFYVATIKPGSRNCHVAAALAAFKVLQSDWCSLGVKSLNGPILHVHDLRFAIGGNGSKPIRDFLG